MSRENWRPGRNRQRDPERIEVVLAKVRKVWHKHPDMRFGQLVVNVLGHDPFFVEDDTTAAMLDAFFERYFDWT